MQLSLLTSMGLSLPWEFDSACPLRFIHLQSRQSRHPSTRSPSVHHIQMISLVKEEDSGAIHRICTFPEAFNSHNALVPTRNAGPCDTRGILSIHFHGGFSCQRSTTMGLSGTPSSGSYVAHLGQQNHLGTLLVGFWPKLLQ